jgi:sec-independent protein translocase protein TatA
MVLLTIKPLLLDLFSGQHMILLVVLVVLLFGGKKIPELAKGLGKGIREFNDAKDGIKNEIENGSKEKDKIQAPNTPNTPSNNA